MKFHLVQKLRFWIINLNFSNLVKGWIKKNDVKPIAYKEKTHLENIYFSKC